jgi:molybdenum cofactor biosynthesis enzyme MoaA
LPQAEEFFNYLRGTVRWLKLQGGEPLAVKSVRELIQSLDKNQTTLAVTTNGTVLDPVLHEALAKMDRVEFTVSLEAIGPANDIIRYGSDWETIKDHILTLKQLPNVDIQINHVLQITSVFYLKDVLQFSEEQGFHLSLQNLCHADYLSLSACPTKYLQKMIEDIDKIEIKHVKNQYIKTFLHNILDNVVFDGNQWNNFKNYINLLDQLRPNRYSSVLKFEEDIL